MYKCGWNGCEKAYGTLNHLNAHVTMQSHGAKRTPEGMLFQPPHFSSTGVSKAQRVCAMFRAFRLQAQSCWPDGATHVDQIFGVGWVWIY